VTLSGLLSTVLFALCAVVLVPVASIELALLIAPAQGVQTAGQSLELSAGPPSLSGSGSGTLELFGQSLPTTQQFSGPIRPRLHWAEVTHYDQLLQALRRPAPIGQALRDGWSAYFTHELVIAVLIALALCALVLLVVRRRWQVVVAGMMIAGLVTGIADAMAIGNAAHGLKQLSDVRTLDQLVGRAPLTVDAPGSKTHAVSSGIVVIGDSTAAGAGNPPVPSATPDDVACRRSIDSYAADIAAVSHSTVDNLACTNASIADGLFSSEYINGRLVPSQLATLGSLHGVRAVLVSIGANEMHWTEFLELCLVSPECDDSASSALFAQTLDSFTVDYYDLLQHLASLPGQPRVIVNEYYDPLAANPECPSQPELTAAKSAVLLDRLNTFNTVLADGARNFGFEAVAPSFAGHELCTAQPFVQGVDDSAPLHPNAAGELVIALADEQALLSPAPPRPTATATPSPT